MALCKDAGAKRAIRLKVSGAFHSPLMETASHGLTEALEATSFDDPHFAVYANVDGGPRIQAGPAKAALLAQLSQPVRWTDEVLALAERYPRALYVEMGPGNVLVGLVKKIAPALATATCGTAAEVTQLRALAA
jgi:[acyl-carrier-protein] S-malonyltransferase